MKQTPLKRSRILMFTCALALISAVNASAQPAQVTAKSSSEAVASLEEQAELTEQQESEVSDRSETVTLQKALARFAVGAIKPLKPDVRNGLIRVAVTTAQGDALDRPTRQALSTKLAQMISQRPNILILEPEAERVVMNRFNRSGLELSDYRSISLGQHLGVRYIVKLSVERSANGNIKLSTKTVSIKRRGSLKDTENEALISADEIQLFQKSAVFYETRLDATWRSALLPGLGQFYQGRLGSAIAYMTLTTGFLIGGISATRAGNEAAKRYQENTSDKVYYRQLANNHYARAQLLWGGLALTWLSSTLSAYLQGEDESHIKLDFNHQQGSLSLSGVF